MMPWERETYIGMLLQYLEKKKSADKTPPSAPTTVKPFAVIPTDSIALQIGVMKAVTGALNRLAIIVLIVGFRRERTQEFPPTAHSSCRSSQFPPA